MTNQREDFHPYGNSSDEEDNLHKETSKGYENKEMSEFSTDKVFISHQDLIEWVQTTGRSLGYVIVTRRTKSRQNGVLSKIIFMCDRGGTYQSKKNSSKNTGTKKIDCPFGLKGNHSLVYDCWTLKVICGTHNHHPASHMEGHPYAMRLSEEETQLVEGLTMNNVKPRDILSTLKKKNQDNVSTSQTVYNALYKFRMTNKAGRSQMQVLMDFLRKEEYIYYTRTNDKTNELEDLFFTHPKSLELWQAFPHVVLMDATYKTNRYKMPLLEIVGVTSTNMTFCIAFVYMHQEKQMNYTWALNCLKSTWDTIISPQVIVTNRELALMKSCKIVYPDAKQLLCRWHIFQSILRKFQSSIKSKHLWESFTKAWASVVESQTEEMYLFNLAQTESLLVDYPGILTYLNVTWLTPYKEMFVSAWTDKFRNFGNHTTNRVESQHAKLKKYLASSQSDLDKSLTYIHDLIQIQETSIKASFEQSKGIVKHRFNMPHFQNLHGFVSEYALAIIYQEFERSKFVGLFSRNCGCHVRSCYGLPCAHEQAQYSNEGQFIPLSSIDRFWRKLDISPCIPIQDEDIDCEDELRKFNQSFNKQSKPVKRNLLRKLKDIFTPSTPIFEPSVHKSTRGRPSLKDKQFKKTTVDPPSQHPLRRSCSNMSNFVDPPSQHPLRRSCSNMSNFVDPHVLGHKESARHSSYFESKPNCSFIYINQFPMFFHPYISQIQDVAADGNCGFRAISASLGHDENDWATVRANLIQELTDYKGEYEVMFGREYLVNIYNALNFFRVGESAPIQYWLTTEMGIMVASKYNVILHMLSIEGSSTFLPLRSYPPPWHQHTYIAIGLVNNCHYVKITLNDGYPMPGVTPQWTHFRYDHASGWATPYERRINTYMEHVRRSDCIPDRIIVDP